MIYAGIDPGLGGAVAVNVNLAPIKFYDTPTITLKKRDYDIQEMVSILVKIRNTGQAHIGIEAVHAMPGQGVTSMFSFGRGLGLWEGIVAALGIPYTMVTPQAWKKLLLDGMPKEKDASVVRAKQLFPTADITLKKHHGRADALLIAEYIRRTNRA